MQVMTGRSGRPHEAPENETVNTHHMVYVQNDHPDGRGDIMRQLLRHHTVHHRVQTLAIIAVLYDRGSQGARNTLTAMFGKRSHS